MVKAPLSREELHGVVNDVGDGSYDCQYVADEAGDHVVEVFINGEHIRGSPFLVPVLGAVAPKTSATGDGVHTAIAGSDSLFVILPFTIEAEAVRLKSCKQLKVIVSDADAEVAVGSVVDHRIDNKTIEYQGLYNVEKAGTLLLSVLLDDEHICGSPFAIDVSAAEPDALHCTADGSGLHRMVFGDNAKVQLDSFDRFGNRVVVGGHRVDIDVKGPQGDVIRSRIHDLRNGSYSGEYDPKKPGQHMCEVLFNRKPLCSMPVLVAVMGPHPPMCFAHGAGVSNAVAGETACFDVYLRTEANEAVAIANPADLCMLITAECHNPADINVNCMQKSSRGEYAVEYVPQSACKHMLNVMLQGQHIKDSPFELNVVHGKLHPPSCTSKLFHEKLPQADEEQPLSKCMPSSLAMPDAVVWHEAVLVVQAKDRCSNPISSGGSNLEVEVYAASRKAQPYQLTTSDMGDGTYVSHFIPRCAGLHMVHAVVDGERIGPSRFKAVVDGIVALKCSAYGAGLSRAATGLDSEFVLECRTASGELCWLGENQMLSIDISPLEGGLFAKLFRTCDSSRTPHSIARKAGERGNYNASYRGPLSLGKNELSVLLDGDHIQGSPFTIDVDAGEIDPTKCEVFGPGTVSAIVGVMTHFTVRAFDTFGNRIMRGGAKLKSSISNDEEDMLGVVQDNGDGSYTVTHAEHFRFRYRVSAHAL